MVVPEIHDRIITNLLDHELRKVFKAISAEEIDIVPDSDVIRGDGGTWMIDFDGKRYLVTEYLDTIISVRLIRSDSGALDSPMLVRTALHKVTA